MSDNLHTFNDEVLEQDEMLADLTALTATVNTNTGNITTINNLNIANKFAGSVSSGLKTLIAGNDTDIANIETKTDFITVSQNVNLDSMESNIATNNSKVTYPSADATKVGRITIDGNLNLSTMSSNITTNINAIDAIELKTDNITCTQAVNLDTMESDIATNNAKVGITPSQSSIITQNSNKLNMTVSSAMKTAVDGNSSSITMLNTAYPRNTILAWLFNQTGNIFYDGNITLNWDATNRQLRFSIVNIASNQYMTGGVTITKPTSQGIQISNYLSLGISAAFKYFTSPQIPASSSYLNSTYNLASYTRAVYWLQPFSLSTFPTYEIKIFSGSTASYMKIHIKKYNN